MFEIRLPQYLAGGKLYDWSIAGISSMFGAQLLLQGHISPMIGLSSSLKAISTMPVAWHGALLLITGFALAYATGAAWTGARFAMMLAYLNFYVFAALSGVAAGRGLAVLVCTLLALAVIWRIMALTWSRGGGRHGSGRDRNCRGSRGRDGAHGLGRLPGQPT